MIDYVIRMEAYMKKDVKRNIILIGSMGSGKSHLGRNLSEAKGWQFVDTDRLLEKRYSMSIANIFKEIGPRAFRSAEIDILKKVCMYHEAVISVGGNFPIEMRTLRYLQKYSYIIGIRAANHRIVNRVSRWVGKRPTMDYSDLPGYVTRMIQRWKPVYRKCNYVIDTTHGNTEQLVSEVQRRLDRDGVVFKKRKM